MLLPSTASLFDLSSMKINLEAELCNTLWYVTYLRKHQINMVDKSCFLFCGGSLQLISNDMTDSVKKFPEKETNAAGATTNSLYEEFEP
ncbi:hypothetical protein PHAVU_004G136900 [Phaseolus vulgaris]|uniref:Uncharacterized protein n=1 Tax=Phaseolus vulgaris TaxID=3885 RepID=V7C6H0_PHAVU|nr:hypothetical protein PHAVU_004G136900g [Phaseolus vulgaris]ESW24511.1 hypothetical protein PHAVU_004G136900g [Phaseolus vulgaris]